MQNTRLCKFNGNCYTSTCPYKHTENHTFPIGTSVVTTSVSFQKFPLYGEVIALREKDLFIQVHNVSNIPFCFRDEANSGVVLVPIKAVVLKELPVTNVVVQDKILQEKNAKIQEQQQEIESLKKQLNELKILHGQVNLEKDSFKIKLVEESDTNCALTEEIQALQEKNQALQKENQNLQGENQQLFWELSNQYNYFTGVLAQSSIQQEDAFVEPEYQFVEEDAFFEPAYQFVEEDAFVEPLPICWFFVNNCCKWGDKCCNGPHP